MEGRDKIVNNAKIGYVAIVMTLLVNLMLSSFIFFDIGMEKVRELFLSIGVLMALTYAVTFPTKLLPSAMYLMRCILFLIVPHLLCLLIASPNNGAVSIVAYVICIVISAFCTYMCIGYHAKVLDYVSHESYNDYVIYEAKTYKAHEINLYNLAFLFVSFFALMAAEGCLYCIIMGGINLVVAVGLGYVRVKPVLGDKIKLVHYILESLATVLAFLLVVLVTVLDLSSLLFIAALVLLVPTITMTVLVYRALDKYMYH